MSATIYTGNTLIIRVIHCANTALPFTNENNLTVSEKIYTFLITETRAQMLTFITGDIGSGRTIISIRVV